MNKTIRQLAEATDTDLTAKLDRDVQNVVALAFYRMPFLGGVVSPSAIMTVGHLADALDTLINFTSAAGERHRAVEAELDALKDDLTGFQRIIGRVVSGAATDNPKSSD